MIQFARRASAILYNLLRSRGDSRPYLLPANICPIVPATFLEAGCPFELIDIEERWLQIDPELSTARLRERPDAYAGMVFVRSYGNELDPTAFFERLRSIQSDLFLIDDRCLCRPDPDGLSLSPLADVTLFSTGRAKYADLDDGGFAHLEASVKYSRHAGPFDSEALDEVERRWKTSITGSSRFAGNVAGWLDLREPETSWSDHRRRTEAQSGAARDQKQRLNSIYETMLPREIQAAPELQNWRFNIRVPDPDRLVASIFSAGLFASRHYAPLGSMFGGRFPVAEAAYAMNVNLFNDLHFDEERAVRTAELVLRHLDQRHSD